MVAAHNGKQTMTKYEITKTERATGAVIEVWTCTEAELIEDMGSRAAKMIETGSCYIPGWGLDYTAVIVAA